MIKFALLSSLLCLVVSTLFGTSIPHQVFSTQDGLPSPDVYFVYQDHESYLWFCTDRGLSRYNGYEFENFTTSDGLTHHTVFGIFTAPNHDLWFQCYDGSITIWEHAHQRFVPFVLNERLQPFVDKRWVAHILFEEELVYLVPNYRADTIIQYNLRDSGDLQAVAVSDFFPEVYVFDSLHLRIRRNADNIVMQTFGPKQAPQILRATLLLSKHEILFSKGEKLFLLNTLEKTCTTVFETTQEIQSITRSGNQLYVGVLNGLHLLEFDNWEVKGHWLSDNRITWSTLDKEGNLWLSVEKLGAIKINSLTGIELYSEINSALKQHENLESMAAITNHLVLGTNDNRLLVLNNQGALLQTSNNVSGRRRFGQGDVVSYLDTYQDTIVGSFFLRVAAGADGLKINTRGANGLQSDISFGVLLKNGSYLYCGQERAMVGKNKENSDFEEEFKLDVPDRIFTVHQDADETIWLASHNSLYRIKNYEYDRIENLTHQLGLQTLSIRSMASNGAGVLVLGTLGYGLILFRDGQLVRIDQSNGLGGNTVNTVCFASDSTLWCGGNYGLSKIGLPLGGKSFSDHWITNFTTTDGLPSSFIKKVLTHDDRIWVLSEKGVFSFRPEELRTSFTAPVLHLVSVSDGSGMAIEPGTELAYNQNTITFSFLGISQLKPKTQAFYSYRLLQNGQEGPWRQTDDRSIWLSSLPAGSFQLEVKAVNKNGVHSKTLSFPFVISPSLNQTWWFRGLIVLLIAVLLYYFYRIRVRRITLESQHSRQLRDAQIRVKQAELSLLRNQMNPHFIFNALTSVQKYILKKDTHKSIKYLSRFSILMRKTLEYSSTELISLSDELAFIRNYLEIEKTRFQDLFEYRIEVDESVDPNQLAIPALLTQPVLENCVKHAFREIDQGGEIAVRFQRGDALDTLLVTIQDNGSGLVPKPKLKSTNGSKHQSFGLGIVKERIEIMNLRTNSTSHFSIANNLPHEAPSGTLAKFELPWQTLTLPQ